MKPDQERVKTLLADTVTLLCRNGLHFQHQLRVQGVIGITIDDSDVFIVHINEAYTEQVRGAKLADFQGPLGSSFAASLVASLSGNVGQNLTTAATGMSAMRSTDSTPPQVNSGAIGQQVVGRQHGSNQKHKQEMDSCTSPLLKRTKPDMQYANSSAIPDAKTSTKDGSATPQHPAITVPAAQWHFDAAAAQKQQQQQQERLRAGDVAAAACYLGYATGVPSTAVTSATVNVPQPSATKRKANVYPPPQSMLAMSFGTVDYGAGVLQQQTARDLCTGINSLQAVTQQPDVKLWTDVATQHAVQQQQQGLSAVFDPLTGCATWTVQHLMDGQGILQARVDDQQQQQNIDEKFPIHDLNPLSMLYAPTDTTTDAGEAGSLTGGETSAQRKQRSKESRRSWTSKHKPYACRHPGCRRSYFFVHDLRRHLRQKHNGMDYNEESGTYEVAATDDPADQVLVPGGESPSSPHDDSDSPDSDDEVTMATASLVG